MYPEPQHGIEVALLANIFAKLGHASLHGRPPDMDNRSNASIVDARSSMSVGSYLALA